jgi:hypothetical protein
MTAVLIAVAVLALLALAALVQACTPARYCPSCGLAGGHAHGYDRGR